jgi:hypothetical protein
MHDDARRQDDVKKKITNNSNMGIFFRVVTLDNPQSRDHCSTSQCGSMGIDPHEQEGKVISLSN